jgi:hypothetical protein
MSELWGRGWERGWGRGGEKGWGRGQETSLDSVNFVNKPANNLIVVCIILLIIPSYL